MKTKMWLNNTSNHLKPKIVRQDKEEKTFLKVSLNSRVGFISSIPAKQKNNLYFLYIILNCMRKKF